MDKFSAYEARLSNGQSLTQTECGELVRVAILAAQFTDANDRGDRFSKLIEEGEEEGELLEHADQADTDYNQSKADLFGCVRAALGWSAPPEA